MSITHTVAVDAQVRRDQIAPAKNASKLSPGEAKALLRNAGLRITRPRVSILRVLHRHPNWHVTVEDLYRHLMSTDEHVTLATCYRATHEFCRAGLIERRVLSEGRSVYEIREGDPSRPYRAR